jgi:hypothetical protein
MKAMFKVVIKDLQRCFMQLSGPYMHTSSQLVLNPKKMHASVTGTV